MVKKEPISENVSLKSLTLLNELKFLNNFSSKDFAKT